MFTDIPHIDIEVVSKMALMQTPQLTSFMTFMSEKLVWIPLYAVLAASLFFKFSYSSRSYCSKERKDSFPMWQSGLLTLVVILLCFALTDSIGFQIKNLTERARPCNEAQLLQMNFTFNHGNPGGFSFPSNHAANVFGLAFSVTFILRRMIYSVLLFIWASLVAFSRLYLGHHYLTDVIGGLLSGLIVAAAIFYLWIYIFRLINSRYSEKCSA